MADRGIADAMMIGLMSDDWPSKEEDAFYTEVSGGLPWVSHSHIPVTRGSTKMENGIVTTGATSQGSAKMDRVGLRVGYHSSVLSCTSFPFTLAARQCIPTSVCMANAKSMAVAPLGRDLMSPFGVNT